MFTLGPCGRRFPPFLSKWGSDDGLRKSKLKAASRARAAFDPNFTTMHLYQIFCDCQPESSAFAYAPSSRSYLIELIENGFAL
jgi:hypothetical protein